MTALAVALFACTQALVPMVANAHSVDGPTADGRIPGQPDFVRVQGATYKYIPALEQYEVRSNGQPPTFVHPDPVPRATKAQKGGPLAYEEGAQAELPTGQVAPICRTSGRRIVVVHTYRPGQSPASSAYLRTLVARMNWKIQDQSSKSSQGQRNLRMVVDCNSSGEVLVHNVQTPNNELTKLFAEVPKALYEKPTGENAVKYLIFDSQNNPDYGGVAEMGCFDVRKSIVNICANFTRSALVTNVAWIAHTPIHELFHTLGAVQLEAPYTTGSSSHCIDGLDVMCYEDGSSKGALYTETRCPSSEGYESPVKFPLDCGFDSYFNAAPPAGSWLASHWDIGGPENPFLIASPNAVTQAAESIQSTKAVMKGLVNPNGRATKYRFEYGLTTAYGSSTTSESIGSGESPVNVAQAVTGLTTGATYHYRVVAESEGGTAYGSDQTFKTFDAHPIVTTKSATGHVPEGSVLQGVVNPNNLDTTYSFEYGTTTAYGSKVPTTPKAVGAGTEDVAVSAAVLSLQPATTYHFRLVATNAEGSSFGADQTFTTVRADVPSRIEAEKYSLTVNAEQGVPHVFSLASGNVKCATAAFAVVNSGAVNAIAATPSFSGCKAFNLNATASPNSCQYAFKVQNADTPYVGTFEIACGKVGDAIKFVPTGIDCQVTIPAQSLSVNYENLGFGSPRSISASISTSMLKYTETGSECASAGVHTDGSLAGSTTFKGASGGSSVGLFMAGVQSQGLRVAGSESAEPANQPRFEAEAYPAILGGEQAAAHTVMVTSGTIKCGAFGLAGSSSAASGAVSLSPSYTGCKAFGFNATVNTNSCQYAFKVQNAGPPYIGTLDIACSKEGDAIKVVPTGISCQVSIPPQSVSVSYENVGVGPTGVVQASISTSALAYTETGAGCSSPGTHANGSYSGGAAIWAL
ncbi:MAG TPA: hypothetical protein VIT89_04135 [Solirubrobacterales bacterium]